MTPSNKNSQDSAGHAANRTYQGLNGTPATLQEQILLQALQGFILPHLGAEIDTDSRKEMAQKLAGPQAKKFIAALKDFISSLIGTPAKAEGETTITVVLNKGHKSELAPNGMRNEQVEASLKPIARPSSSCASVENRHLLLSTPVPTILSTYDKVLLALRSNVFNRMPIRLLRFDQEGPILEISLIERTAIYEHLMSVLPAWHDNAAYEPTLLSPALKDPRMETEDEVIARIVQEYSGYAILSHTWLQRSPELTYGNWKAGSFDAKGPGYCKLVNFCKVAYTIHGLTLGWMDTVCINKDSSSELDESIRSMYNWYKRSKVCIVHLADTEFLPEMHRDTWFTRGWTLQELLAPKALKFYGQSWKQLVDSDNDKNDKRITDKVNQATTISTSELENIRHNVPMSRRMQLAAPREVTREEDAAYSLMGLFNVSISTAYGEGADHAFYRLLQEILSSTSFGVLDLFNWAGEDWSSTWELLPSSPRRYLERATDVELQFIAPIEPLMSTHMGVRIPLLLMPGIATEEGAFRPCGNYSASASISPLAQCKYVPTSYRLLQQQESHSDSHSPIWSFTGQCQFTFAVFNVSKKDQDIIVPPKCIAILLACYEAPGMVSSTGNCIRVHTKEPVVFDMLKRNTKQCDSSAEDYMVKVEKDEEIRIPEQDLAKHGMQLVSKYL